ncbi:hypothetical protein GCM10027612_16020 [Microbispora bryophytorum subsp. camponoti]
MTLTFDEVPLVPAPAYNAQPPPASRLPSTVTSRITPKSWNNAMAPVWSSVLMTVLWRMISCVPFAGALVLMIMSVWSPE